MLQFRLTCDTPNLDSSDWVTKFDINGLEYKENPEGDIWEHNGVQYFSMNGVCRLRIKPATPHAISPIRVISPTKEPTSSSDKNPVIEMLSTITITINGKTYKLTEINN